MKFNIKNNGEPKPNEKYTQKAKSSECIFIGQGHWHFGIFNFPFPVCFRPDCIDLRAAIKSNEAEPLRRFGSVKDP